MSTNYTFYHYGTNNSSNSAVDSSGEGIKKTGVKSPEWMVKIDDLLSSSVEGFEKYAELFDWSGESSRHTTGEIANSLFTSATLNHSSVTLLIPNGGFAPVIETTMNKGVLLKSIEIIRLGNIEEVKVKVQSITYKKCRIQNFRQLTDRLFISIIPTIKVNKVFVYTQEGRKKGQTISEVNYSTNVVK